MNNSYDAKQRRKIYDFRIKEKEFILNFYSYADKIVKIKSGGEVGLSNDKYENCFMENLENISHISAS